MKNMDLKHRISACNILCKYVTCKDDIRILHRSSLATFDCFIREIAVTKVSIADPYSLQEASGNNVRNYINIVDKLCVIVALILMVL